MIGDSAILTWLVQTLAIGGGLLMLAAALMAVVRQPVRRRMIGAAAGRIALLVPLLALGPKWLLIPLPEPAPTAAAVGSAPENYEAPRVAEAPPTSRARETGPDDYDLIFVPVERERATPPPAKAAPDVEPPVSAPAAAQAPEPTKPIPWRQAVLLGYGLIAGGFLARWAFAQLALLRVIRSSRPAGRELRQLFERVAARDGFVPELRVVPNDHGPVCCGLWRPVVLLPQRLAETGDEESLRWIFAHELAHLRRGDAWTAFWFGLAESLYFALPWFWWLKRQVRLCQEYVADAEAAADAKAEEYAAFLVNLSRSPRGRRLAAASGVLGSPSELYRRISMLLKDSKPVERSCPRRWSLLAVSGLLSLAVILSGIGVVRYAAAQDKPKEEKKAAQDEPKKDKDAPKAEKPEKEPEEKLVRPQRPRFRALVPQGGPIDPEDFQKQVEKMLEEMQKQFPDGGFQGQWVPLHRFGNNPFFGGQAGSGRLGVSVEKPSPALVEQLDLPKDQGLVLVEVKGDSAAAKAGLKANDIVLEFNGKPVASDANEFRKLVNEIKADTAVGAVVLRKGKRQTVTGLKLPEAKAEAENPFGNFRRIGGGVGGNFAPPAGPNHLPAAPVPVPFNEGNFDLPLVPGAKGLSIQIANDQFTVQSRDESMDITVGGRLEDGKTVVNHVKINDGTDRHSYDKMENVPEKYREKVNGLLKNIVIKK